MAGSATLLRKIEHIRVNRELKEVLWAIVEEIEQSREQAVTKTDFSDLKAIVGELAQAQKELVTAQQRTEQRVEDLTAAQQRTEQRVEDLTAAQQRTEQRMEELAAAQQRTEQHMEELAEAQKETSREVAKLARSLDETNVQVSRLARSLDETNSRVGGLARSMGYALENDAYCKLPRYLAAQYQLQITERFIRTEIAGEEINFFANARRNGEEVVIVGETVVKLDDRSKLEQLENAVNAVRETTSLPIIPLIVTHYARPQLLAKIQQEGIIVVQSFEWDTLT